MSRSLLAGYGRLIHLLFTLGFRGQDLSKFETVQKEFEAADICFLLPHHALQLLPRSPDNSGDASHGSRGYGPRLGGWGDRGSVGGVGCADPIIAVKELVTPSASMQLKVTAVPTSRSRFAGNPAILPRINP